MLDATREENSQDVILNPLADDLAALGIVSAGRLLEDSEEDEEVEPTVRYFEIQNVH